MPNYIPISNDLYLFEQEVKSKKTVVKREAVNHIWIYDRSGSMCTTLRELVEQLIKLCKGLPMGDTLTLGWFSGEGDFNFIFKGFKISDKSDYKALEKSIRENSTTRNTTCFSEILGATDQVVKDLTVFSKVFSLHFFTDGYPVVSNYTKEINNIYSAIDKIKGKVTSAMLVGYGYYYNKELMSKMAEKLGAVLISSSQIPEYAESITRLIKLSGSQEAKEEVDVLDDKPLAIYTVTDQGVVVYSVEDDGKLYISPTVGKATSLFYLTSKKPNTKNWTKIDLSAVDFSDSSDKISKALYAGALVLTQQTKTDIALEVVGKIGDKAVVDNLVNAFTIEEYTKAEDKINLSITDTSARFSEGRKENYVPPADAFCVFDLVNVLMDDEDAAFLPYHPKFEYEKISVSAKTKDDFAKFTADKTSKCPFGNLTWHQSRLNLSVQTNIPGTVGLLEIGGKTAKQLGLAKDYPANIFRNYTLIKDGRVHTKKLYISSSDATYKLLKNKGLVFDDTFKADGIYGLDISSLSAVNRKIATGKTSAKALCTLVINEQKLKGQVKSLKWLKEDKFGTETTKTTTLSDEQVNFLLQNGVDVLKGGVYNAPRDMEEAKDKYMAKTFDIKIAGLSSIPAVKKVMEKIASKKKLTASEELVNSGIELHAKKKFADDKEHLKWLETTISEKQKEMRAIRAEAQATKFAIILGKKWFDEFKSRSETTLEQDGYSFEFALGEEAVEI